jgi:surface protein
LLFWFLDEFTIHKLKTTVHKVSWENFKGLVYVWGNLKKYNMKQLLFIFLLVISITNSQAQVTPGSPDNFITVWNTLATTSITIPTTGFGYNYNLYWEEISNPTNNGNLLNITGNANITGLTTGANYRVEIAGNFPRFYMNNNSFERLKLSEVSQWGNIQWTSMEDAFNGSSNMNVTATDTPNLTTVINCPRMFAGCSSLNGIGANWNWNTGNITNMVAMFWGATLFNQEIGSWDIGNTVNVQQMFHNAASFNQNIGNWNTSNIENMWQMFNNATSFNQDISNWNTMNVTTMFGMFSGASAFNQNIGNWNTENVTQMHQMFWNATAFNQNIANWNTSNVTNMNSMFNNAASFNQNIGNWNTESLTDLGGMFSGAILFNQPIGNWNTSNVTSLFQTFSNASSFNQDLGNWNLSALTNMSNMLSNSGMDCYNYSQTLIGWAANSNTPNSLGLGASGRQYGTNAVAARDILVNTKGWSINGDAASGTDCSTAAPTPALTVTANMSAFAQTLGVPSPEQSFTVSGSDLTDNITVTAPTNYEVSLTSGSGFASSVQVNQTGGTVPSTTIYVRLNATAVGAHSGNITLTSGALSETVGVTGNTTQNTSGINENALNQLFIFPNPASNSVNLIAAQPTTAVFMSANGAILSTLELNGETTIDVSTYAPGVYFIRTAEGQTVKFVKE